jgi:hypothetical protein
MSKFIYIYRGPVAEMSEEDGAAWGAWMGKLGSSMLDMGAPFGHGTVVVDDGSTSKLLNLTGYTIVEAADLTAAAALTNGNPLLLGNKGLYSIEIFELIAM